MKFVNSYGGVAILRINDIWLILVTTRTVLDHVWRRAHCSIWAVMGAHISRSLRTLTNLIVILGFECFGLILLFELWWLILINEFLPIYLVSKMRTIRPCYIFELLEWLYWSIPYILNSFIINFVHLCNCYHLYLIIISALNSNISISNTIGINSTTIQF